MVLAQPGSGLTAIYEVAYYFDAANSGWRFALVFDYDGFTQSLSFRSSVFSRSSARKEENRSTSYSIPMLGSTCIRILYLGKYIYVYIYIPTLYLYTRYITYSCLLVYYCTSSKGLVLVLKACRCKGPRGWLPLTCCGLSQFRVPCGHKPRIRGQSMYPYELLLLFWARITWNRILLAVATGVLGTTVIPHTMAYITLNTQCWISASNKGRSVFYKIQQ